MSKPKLLAALLALAHLTCSSVPLTAPSGSSLSINANPEFVAAHGGTSAVTVVVVEPAGTFVPDGTVVFFLTNLGTIDAQAKTKDGFARATFVSDSRSGTATVTAFSGGDAPTPTTSPSTNPSPAAGPAGVTAAARGTVAATGSPVVAAAIQDTVSIVVGSANPVEVILTANPPRITEPRNTELTANVYDKDGNPVSNVPVIFTIVSVTSTRLLQESLDSGGQPRFTNTNGQAHDTLRTSQNRVDAQKQVNVLAAVPGIGLASESVAVFVN